MKNTMLQKTEKNFDLKPSTILMLPLLAIVELLFLFPTWDVFLAPVLALLLCFFYFVAKKRELVAAILIFGNDALGTLVMGSISTVYLVFLFLLWEIINLRKVRFRPLIIGCVGVLIAMFPGFLGVITLKASIITAAYIMLLVLLSQREDSGENFIENMKLALTCVIFLQALHMLVTGGIIVEEETGRAGLIGVGIGDANYSSLVLCIGIASTLTYKKFKWFIKLAVVGVMIAAIVATLSISGLIAMFVVIVCSLSLDGKFYKLILRILVVIVALVLIYQLYISLPDNFHIEGVDNYIARVEEKMEIAERGDIGEATTNRSSIAARKLEYFFTEASPFHQIFGLTPITAGGGVPHNTYLDFLLQFGIIGVLIAIVYMIMRFGSSVISLKRGDKSHKYIITLKVLFLFFAFTLSIYDGPTFAMFFLACFML